MADGVDSNRRRGVRPAGDCNSLAITALPLVPTDGDLSSIAIRGMINRRDRLRAPSPLWPHQATALKLKLEYRYWRLGSISALIVHWPVLPSRVAGLTMNPASTSFPIGTNLQHPARQTAASLPLGGCEPGCPDMIFSGWREAKARLEFAGVESQRVGPGRFPTYRNPAEVGRRAKRAEVSFVVFMPYGPLRAVRIILKALKSLALPGDSLGTRTPVFAVRGRRPRPLDEGSRRVRHNADGAGTQARQVDELRRRGVPARGSGANVPVRPGLACEARRPPLRRCPATSPASPFTARPQTAAAPPAAASPRRMSAPRASRRPRSSPRCGRRRPPSAPPGRPSG